MATILAPSGLKVIKMYFKYIYFHLLFLFFYFIHHNAFLKALFFYIGIVSDTGVTLEDFILHFICSLMI